LTVSVSDDTHDEKLQVINGSHERPTGEIYAQSHPFFIEG
jgi:hypothetical protein